jgi:hypothetical protein
VYWFFWCYDDRVRHHRPQSAYFTEYKQLVERFPPPSERAARAFRGPAAPIFPGFAPFAMPISARAAHSARGRS